MVFLKEFFEKVDFEKNQQIDLEKSRQSIHLLSHGTDDYPANVKPFSCWISVLLNTFVLHSSPIFFKFTDSYLHIFKRRVENSFNANQLAYLGLNCFSKQNIDILTQFTYKKFIN